MEKEIMELIDEFVERLQALKNEYDTPECLKEGDEYWYIGRDGSAYADYWSDYFDIDKDTYDIGNVFKRKEGVVHAIGKLKVIQELRELGRPFKYGYNNWCLFMDDEGEICCSLDNVTQTLYSPLYFDTEEDAQEAIDKVGADRIKRYLFDRKDDISHLN